MKIENSGYSIFTWSFNECRRFGVHIRATTLIDFFLVVDILSITLGSIHNHLDSVLYILVLNVNVGQQLYKMSHNNSPHFLSWSTAKLGKLYVL